MFEPRMLVKKPKCSCKGELFVSTGEGEVCISCGVVNQKYDLDYTTFEQKTHYDIIPPTEEELRRYSYPVATYLLSISGFETMDVSVQNSLISQCIEVLGKLFKDGVVGRGVEEEVLVALSLVVILGNLGVPPWEVLKVFSRKNDFESYVMALYRVVESRYPQLVHSDPFYQRFADRVLNILDIQQVYRKPILSLFRGSLEKVWFNGTHPRIILAVCVLWEVKEGEERDWAYFYFLDEWGLSENILKAKLEKLEERLNVEKGV